MTIGDLTDKIIATDYSPSTAYSMRPHRFPFHPDSEQWKFHHRMLQKEEQQSPSNQNPMHQFHHSQQQQQQQQQQQAQGSKSSQGQGRSSTPDDRHIIRMAQVKYQESVSPEGHFYQPQPPHADRKNWMDSYVKNRIAEAMRTSDEEKRAEDNQDLRQHDTQNIHHQSHKELERRSTPVEMAEESHSAHNSYAEK